MSSTRSPTSLSNKHVNFHKSSSTISAHANLNDLFSAQKALSDRYEYHSNPLNSRRPMPLKNKSFSAGEVLEGKIISITPISSTNHNRSYSYDPNASTTFSEEAINTPSSTPSSKTTIRKNLKTPSSNVNTFVDSRSTESTQHYNDLPYHTSSLGDIYSNISALKAYCYDKLGSESIDETSKLRIIFINQTSKPLILCWVGFDHKLHHYYKLEPYCKTTITGGLDSGSSNLQLNAKFEGGIHLENTFLGHSFVIGTCPNSDSQDYNDDDDEQSFFDDGDEDDYRVSKWCWIPFFGKSDRKSYTIETDNDWDRSKLEKIIAAYRPRQHSLQKSSINDYDSEISSCLHMVTITEELYFASTSALPKVKFHLSVMECTIDNTPLDTSNKVYKKNNWDKWTVYCEDGLFSSHDDKNDAVQKELLQQFRQRFQSDLTAASKKLPRAACEDLKKTTPFWINKSQKYGPKLLPVRGEGMCFHPETEWLRRNGMNEDKSGGIELYEAAKYLDDCDLWYGAGGVLIHELAHAFHHKCVKDGYNNQEIIDCYNAAMDEELYDCVEVHNCEGGTDKCQAYACTNAMEYFAELSVAFLGGVDEDKDLEFNKWYPFNRRQIRKHDPRAYHMLKKIWNVK